MTLLPLPVIDVAVGAVLVALGVGLTTMLLITGLGARLPASARVRARLAALEASVPSAQIPTTALRDDRFSNVPVIESVLRGRTWVAHTQQLLGQASLPLRVGEYLGLRAAAIVLGAAVGFLIAQRVGGDTTARLFFVAIGGGFGWLAPAAGINVRMRRRRQEIETQLIELCDVMAALLQSGYGYVQALIAAAEEVGSPLSTELQRMLDVVRLGGDIDEALDELVGQLGSRDFDLIASAIVIQRRSGANLGEILSGVATTIRQRQAFMREVRALTSRERFSALVVAGFPLLLVAMLTWMAPGVYGLLFTETIGRIILVVAIALDAVGFLVIRRLTQLEV